MAQKDDIGDLERTLVELGHALGQEPGAEETQDPAHGDEWIPDELWETLDGAAVFLDFNVVDMAREALGKDIPVEDPRLLDLALTVVSYKTIKDYLTRKQNRDLIRGGAREKVGFTVDLLRKQIQEQIAELAKGSPQPVTWSGPDDFELAAFSLTVLSADHLAAMLQSLDLVEAMAVAGVDLNTLEPPG